MKQATRRIELSAPWITERDEELVLETLRSGWLSLGPNGPRFEALLAEATNEYGVVITSSPGSTPARRMQRWRPAVPDETAAQNGAPTASASARSNRGPAGPSESRPERSTSSTSSSSRSSIHGALRLIRVVVLN